MPGFAACHAGQEIEGRAFCTVNVGAFLGAVAAGHIPQSELPYFMAEAMMHEIVHALEEWAGVEFSEERVEALTEKYRQARSAAKAAKEMA